MQAVPCCLKLPSIPSPLIGWSRMDSTNLFSTNNKPYLPLRPASIRANPTCLCFLKDCNSWHRKSLMTSSGLTRPTTFTSRAYPVPLQTSTVQSILCTAKTWSCRTQPK